MTGDPVRVCPLLAMAWAEACVLFSLWQGLQAGGSRSLQPWRLDVRFLTMRNGAIMLPARVTEGNREMLCFRSARLM